MINGDLSEYNILTEGTRVWLIDWPQWVSPSHPNTEELLKRDTRAVLQFFERAYGVSARPRPVAGVREGRIGGRRLWARPQKRTIFCSRIRFVTSLIPAKESSSIDRTSGPT